VSLREAACLVACLVAAHAAGVGAACAQNDLAPLVIGSKNFTENRLLGEMMAQLVEAELGIEVERRVNLGGTKVVFSALTSGEIDLYAEYTGTGWSVHLRREERVADPLRTFLEVSREFGERFDVVWLDPFGFENSYALAMDEATAQRLGVRTISDLLPHQAELSAGVSHEFLNRVDGFPGLIEAYGLKLGDVRGMEHGLAYEAIRTGRVDIVDTWTTDGKLLRYDIRILEDDRGFFPPYDAAPIARRDALERFPDLRGVLRQLAFRLDDATMRRLNFAVEEQGGAFEDVAHDALAELGLVNPAIEVAPAKERSGFLTFFWQRRAETLHLVEEHLWLTLAAVGLAILFAVPLGLALTRWDAAAGPVLSAAGVIQTVPSLALLAFMIPLLGLGAKAAITALFLYALLPIVRNTHTGVKEVDDDLLEAARGMGLRDGQILWRIELPLATRTIMAGIRTSTVISIGVATLAAFIGAGGLGDPIVTGLQLNDTYLIFSGAIPAALLAVVADALLGWLERWLAPRTSQPSS
jgi:osmoprotectant transport system permease protein